MIQATIILPLQDSADAIKAKEMDRSTTAYAAVIRHSSRSRRPDPSNSSAS